MGWLLVVDQGLPRYWATVWVALHGAALHESTLSAHLSVIESMYRSVQIQLEAFERLYDSLRRHGVSETLRQVLGE